MKKIDAFTEEFTDNFSELFIESFMIRYLSEYPEKNLIKVLSKSINLVTEKIKITAVQKITDQGYNADLLLKEMHKRDK